MNRSNNPRIFEEIVGLDAWTTYDGEGRASVYVNLAFCEGRLHDDYVSFTLRIRQAELHAILHSGSSRIKSGTAQTDTEGYELLYMRQQERSNKWVIKPSSPYLDGKVFNEKKSLFQVEYEQEKIATGMLFSVICKKQDLDIEIIEVNGKSMTSLSIAPENYAAALAYIKKRLLDIGLSYDASDRAHSNYTIADYSLDFPG